MIPSYTDPKTGVLVITTVDTNPAECETWINGKLVTKPHDMTISETLKQLDELEARATKGEWHQMTQEDLSFVLSLKNSYPSLRAEIERLQEENKNMRWHLDDLMSRDKEA